MIDWLKMRKQNRNLKRELRLADDQIEQARKQLSEQKKIIADQQATITALRQDKQHLNDKIEEIKGNLREQTAADLLVNALIGLGVIPKPKEKYNPFDEQRRLADLQAMANRHGSMSEARAGQAFGNPLGSLLGT